MRSDEASRRSHASSIFTAPHLSAGRRAHHTRLRLEQEISVAIGALVDLVPDANLRPFLRTESWLKQSRSEPTLVVIDAICLRLSAGI